MEKGFKKYKEGFLLGKFFPPHAGHLHLINVAADSCEHLTVLMCSIKREPIPGKLRHDWLSRSVTKSNVTVVHVTDENPQLPEEHPDFWQIWVDTIRRNTPAGLDSVFSSEDYGNRLAELLEIEHVMVDRERKSFPISATMIRNNPLKHWDSIVGPAKPYFVKRIAVVGAESTGKSVLCRRLAEHFETSFVPEYGREFCERTGGTVELMDFPEIAVMQNIREDEATESANKILFCDTENVTTKVFCHLYYPEQAQELDGFFDYLIKKHSKKYAKYFLLSADGVPEVQDGTRMFLSSRRGHEEAIISELSKAEADYTKVAGGFDERFEFIKNKIESELF